MLQIRTATATDKDRIFALHVESFGVDEGHDVASLAVNLLGETAMPRIISLVAELGDALAGHVAFSPMTIDAEPHWSSYILSPLAVGPKAQGQGIGSRLVKEGLDLLTAQGVDAVFVYGDPAYYGRFGFSAEAAESYVPPYQLEYPFGWQARAL